MSPVYDRLLQLKKDEEESVKPRQPEPHNELPQYGNPVVEELLAVKEKEQVKERAWKKTPRHKVLEPEIVRVVQRKETEHSKVAERLVEQLQS